VIAIALTSVRLSNAYSLDGNLTTGGFILKLLLV